MQTHDDVLAFWRAAGPERWFRRDDDFDARVRSEFSALCETAAQGGLPDWEMQAGSALALVILLDQFPRNMFRGQARAFASDDLARSVTARAIDHGFDASVDPPLRRFFYLPFMHSERLADQDYCVELHRKAHDEDGLKYAIEHRDIIARFGRFPHRNAALSRITSEAEQDFLDAGGFKG